MNKREFLLSNVELSTKVREYISENGMSIASLPNGIWEPKGLPAPTTTEAKFKKATDEEIDALYGLLGVEYSEESSTPVVSKPQAEKVPFELIKNEQFEEITTKAGEKVKVLMSVFNERTSGKTRNFKFTLKSGLEIIVNPYDNVIALGLQKGDLFPINPETLVFTKQEGFIFGKPNFSHSTFSEIQGAREELADQMEVWETKMRIKGATQKEISEQRISKLKADNPMPTLKGFKFLK